MLLVASGATAQNKAKGKNSKNKVFVEGRQKIRELECNDKGDSTFYTINKFTQFSTKSPNFYYIPYDYAQFNRLNAKKDYDWGEMKPVINFLEKMSRASLQMCIIYAVNPDVLDLGRRQELEKQGRTEAQAYLEKFKTWMTAKGFRNKTNFQIAEIDFRYFKGANYYSTFTSDELIRVGLLFYFGSKKRSFFPDPNEGTRTFADIKFLPNDATILDSWTTEIDDLAAYLQDNERKGVLLLGYADNQGTPEYCIGLSRQRATEIKKALQTRGIKATRIEIEAKGDSDPIGDNNTYEGRMANNRVSIKIQ